MLELGRGSVRCERPLGEDERTKPNVPEDLWMCLHLWTLRQPTGFNERSMCSRIVDPPFRLEHLQKLRLLGGIWDNYSYGLWDMICWRTVQGTSIIQELPLKNSTKASQVSGIVSQKLFLTFSSLQDCREVQKQTVAHAGGNWRNRTLLSVTEISLPLWARPDESFNFTGVVAEAPSTFRPFAREWLAVSIPWELMFVISSSDIPS